MYGLGKEASLHSGLVKGMTANYERPWPRDVVKFEKRRLDTLKSWPSRHAYTCQSLRNIAKAGLYFVGPKDKLKCAFCNGAMINFEDDDDPVEGHFKYFGDRCPLARNEPTDNVPLGDHSRSTINIFEKLNIVTERPKHLEFGNATVRNTSFKNWPKRGIQDPQKLAEAGFFYTGTEDIVNCFFCGIKLKSWDCFDDPWILHAQFADKCGFVSQMKGPDFIHEAKRKFALIYTQLNADKEENIIAAKKITAAMALPMTQIVISKGFDRDLVKRVIETKILTTGDNFANATELAEKVIMHQENENKG